MANGKNFEEVTLAEVEQSPQGLRGWGEMALSVPGIEDCPSESAVSTPRSGNGKRKTEAEAKDDTAEGAPKRRLSFESDKDPKATKAESNETKAKGGKKPKQTINAELKDAEKAARNIVLHMQKATQIVDRIAQEVDRMPSEWSWTRPLADRFPEASEEAEASPQPRGRRGFVRVCE